MDEIDIYYVHNLVLTFILEITIFVRIQMLLPLILSNLFQIVYYNGE
jgi:hypothetical protein